jgi:hypothetical protein
MFVERRRCLPHPVHRDRNLQFVVPAKARSFAGVSIGMPIAGGTPRACQREPQCRCLVFRCGTNAAGFPPARERRIQRGSLRPCHPGEGRGPSSCRWDGGEDWIPAFAGMTNWKGSRSIKCWKGSQHFKPSFPRRRGVSPGFRSACRSPVERPAPASASPSVVAWCFAVARTPLGSRLRGNDEEERVAHLLRCHPGEGRGPSFPSPAAAKLGPGLRRDDTRDESASARLTRPDRRLVPAGSVATPTPHPPARCFPSRSHNRATRSATPASRSARRGR